MKLDNVNFLQWIGRERCTAELAGRDIPYPYAAIDTDRREALPFGTEVDCMDTNLVSEQRLPQPGTRLNIP